MVIPTHTVQKYLRVSLPINNIYNIPEGIKIIIKGHSMEKFTSSECRFYP